MHYDDPILMAVLQQLGCEVDAFYEEDFGKTSPSSCRKLYPHRFYSNSSFLLYKAIQLSGMVDRWVFPRVISPTKKKCAIESVLAFIGLVRAITAHSSLSHWSFAMIGESSCNKV